MRFFIDTADTNEIRELAATDMVDGVTTNPSLAAKAGRPFREVLAEICSMVPGPISAEVTATAFDGMLAEARALRAVAENVVVKVPLTVDGLRACRVLADEGVPVNVTLVFSPAQALLAAKAGAAFVSPFVGRLDDIGADGMGLIADIMDIFGNHPEFETEVLVASVRHPMHVVEAAKLGADAVTMPPKVLRQLYAHPLTDRGLEAFLADWRKTGQSILEG